MSESDKNKFFKEIQPELNSLEQNLKSINDNLESNGITTFRKNAGNRSLEQQFKKSPNGVEAFGPIENFIQVSISLKEKLRAYTDSYSHFWGIEQRKVREARKNERKDMWILWLQKLFRWCAGAMVAIFLYSGVVWLSEKCTFMRVS
jgi:hypothetical protein